MAIIDCEAGDDAEMERYDADLDHGGGTMQANAVQTASGDRAAGRYIN